MSSFGPQTTGPEISSSLSSHITSRTFLITGTSVSSLGASVALTLAAHFPSQLILVSRTRSKVEPVIASIAAINPSIRVVFVECDLTDLTSVRRAADVINAEERIPKIDVVLNNAGVMFVRDRTLDVQGFEMTLSACYLGHFLLTSLLMAKISAAGPDARIVNVSSHGHRVSPFRFDDWNLERQYDGWSAYGQAKTACILFSVELARRGVRAYSVEPGSVYETGLGGHLLDEDRESFGPVVERNTGKSLEFAPKRTVEEGTGCILVACLDPALMGEEGAYVSDGGVGQAEAWAVDGGNARRLWALSEELVGQKFEI